MEVVCDYVQIAAAKLNFCEMIIAIHLPVYRMTIAHFDVRLITFRLGEVGRSCLQDNVATRLGKTEVSFRMDKLQSMSATIHVDRFILNE